MKIPFFLNALKRKTETNIFSFFKASKKDKKKTKTRLEKNFSPL
jgi:hypothetical protein